ncbi:hypothetical protein C8R42DRAFT_689713 [Lentinula raphanica]|nr:hypothetical protein C8R42DRAFT_689713 [Lentinula raphanica]
MKKFFPSLLSLVQLSSVFWFCRPPGFFAIFFAHSSSFVVPGLEVRLIYLRLGLSSYTTTPNCRVCIPTCRTHSTPNSVLAFQAQ